MIRKYGVAVLTAITAFTITPTIAQASTTTENYYIQPSGQCSDKNNGKSKDKAFCSLSALSNSLEKEYKNGKARGDINVIFNSGSTYEKIVGANNYSRDKFTFSPAAGHKVNFTTNGSKKAIIKGTSHPRKDENKIGMVIQPTKNRGGTFVVENLEFRNLNDGLLINGGVNMSDKYNFNTPRNGVISGQNAPIQNAVIRNNNFINMGTKYAPGYLINKNKKKDELNYNGSGALRFWNTYNLTIENNNFTNFYQKKNTGLSHVLYGYFSNNSNIVNNTFKNTNSTVVHGRMGNNWNVKNNKFNNTTKSEVSTWYRNIKYSPLLDSSYNRNAECKVNSPQLSGNVKNNSTNTQSIKKENSLSSNASSLSSNSTLFTKIRNFFRRLDIFNLFYTPKSKSTASNNTKNTTSNNTIKQSIYAVSENPWCKKPRRVYAPSTINWSSTSNGIKVDYKGATTNNNNRSLARVVKNEIYAVNDKMSKPVLVSTVKGKDGSTTITNQQLKKLGFKDNEEIYLSVVSVNNRGDKTSSTGNRFSFTIGEQFGSVQQYAADVKN